MIIVIDTYDVQDVDISLTGRELTLTCSYATNTTAQGCLVNVCKREGTQIDSAACETYFSFTTSPTCSPFTVNEVGEYIVTSVADIEEDGIINAIDSETFAAFYMADTAISAILSTTPEEITPEETTPGEETTPAEGTIPAEELSTQAGELSCLITYICWKITHSPHKKIVSYAE